MRTFFRVSPFDGQRYPPDHEGSTDTALRFPSPPLEGRGDQAGRFESCLLELLSSLAEYPLTQGTDTVSRSMARPARFGAVGMRGTSR